MKRRTHQQVVEQVLVGPGDAGLLVRLRVREAVGLAGLAVHEAAEVGALLVALALASHKSKSNAAQVHTKQTRQHQRRVASLTRPRNKAPWHEATRSALPRDSTTFKNPTHLADGVALRALRLEELGAGRHVGGLTEDLRHGWWAGGGRVVG